MVGNSGIIFSSCNKLVDPECLNLNFADKIEAKTANIANYEFKKI